MRPAIKVATWARDACPVGDPERNVLQKAPQHPLHIASCQLRENQENIIELSDRYVLASWGSYLRAESADVASYPPGSLNVTDEHDCAMRKTFRTLGHQAYIGAAIHSLKSLAKFLVVDAATPRQPYSNSAPR